jgi:hypothetical protein
MKFNLIYLLLIVFILFSISSVCASDVDNSIIQATDDSVYSIEENTLLQSNIDNEILTENEGSFSDLRNLINGNDVVNLTKDYVATQNDNPITISKNLVINGNGHSISGNKTIQIFKISGGNIVLNNLSLEKGFTDDSDGGAIYVESANSLTLNYVTFTDNYADIRC